MLIKEVEKATGITRKNIRFYEDEGLLKPDRNTGNRYRNYSDDDIKSLLEIKLLRKLGISLGDIKKVKSGELSLENCMEKYLDIFVMQKKRVGKSYKALFGNPKG